MKRKKNLEEMLAREKKKMNSKNREETKFECLWVKIKKNEEEAMKKMDW